MSVVRAGLLLASIGIVILTGCGGHQRFPSSSLTGGVFEVKIDESVSPAMVTVKRGDEVRWINQGSAPVDVAVVQTREELISCQKGFGSTNLGYLFGTSEYENIVMATLQPHEFASLCFAIPGKFVYTVRKGPAWAGSPTKVSGSITVE
jgi:plastocyanin